MMLHPSAPEAKLWVMGRRQDEPTGFQGLSLPPSPPAAALHVSLPRCSVVPYSQRKLLPDQNWCQVLPDLSQCHHASGKSSLTSAMQNKSDAASMDGCRFSCSQCIWKGSFSCPSLAGLSCTTVMQPICPHMPRDSTHAGQHGVTISRANAPAALAPRWVSGTAAHLQYADHKVLTNCVQLGTSNMDATHSGRRHSFFILVWLSVEHRGSSVFHTLCKYTFSPQNEVPKEAEADQFLSQVAIPIPPILCSSLPLLLAHGPPSHLKLLLGSSFHVALCFNSLS